MEWFKALKNGEFSMPVTFWFCNIGVSFVAYVLFRFIFATFRAPIISFILLVIFALVYKPLVLLGMWRSANDYDGPTKWSFFVKILTVFAWFEYLAILCVTVGIAASFIGHA